MHLLRSGGSTHSFISEYLSEDGIQTPGPLELRLTLKKPYQTLLQRLTTPEFILVPKSSIKNNVVDLSVSSGAYFVAGLDKAKSRGVYKANTYYSKYSRSQPSEVVLEEVPSSSLIAAQKLSRGELNFYLGTLLPTNEGYNDILHLIQTGSIKAEEVVPSSVALLIIQDSNRIRSREQRILLAKILGEKAQADFGDIVSHQLYPPGCVGHLPPQTERQLFSKITSDANAISDAIPKHLLGLEGSIARVSGIASWVTRALEAAGIRIESRLTTATELFDHKNKIEYDYLVLTTGLNAKDPAGSLLYLVSPKDGLIPDPDGKFNALLQKAVEANASDRASILTALSSDLMLSGRIIPLLHYGTTVLSSANLTVKLPTPYDDEIRFADMRWN